MLIRFLVGPGTGGSLFNRRARNVMEKLTFGGSAWAHGKEDGVVRPI